MEALQGIGGGGKEKGGKGGGERREKKEGGEREEGGSREGENEGEKMEARMGSRGQAGMQAQLVETAPVSHLAWASLSAVWWLVSIL